MKLHTVFITYNRLELTKLAIASYLATVTVPFSFSVVDNGSDDGTRKWLLAHATVPSLADEWIEAQSTPRSWKGEDMVVHALDENKYPGHACNLGWSYAPSDATHFQRADNDFAFLSGWCDEVQRVFESKKVGQVGLRTGSEEKHGQYNVGGNCVIRRELWDLGLRYDERPWPQLREEVGPGHTEDSLFSPEVTRLGYTWTRVQKPCIVSLAREDPDDDYYTGTWSDRGILEWARDTYS